MTPKLFLAQTDCVVFIALVSVCLVYGIQVTVQATCAVKPNRPNIRSVFLPDLSSTALTIMSMTHRDICAKSLHLYKNVTKYTFWCIQIVLQCLVNSFSEIILCHLYNWDIFRQHFTVSKHAMQKKEVANILENLNYSFCVLSEDNMHMKELKTE